MSTYSKLFAAIISTLLSRWLAQYLGLTPEELGIHADLQMAVSLALDAGFAAVNGFWVWLLPNLPASEKRDSQEFEGENV